MALVYSLVTVVFAAVLGIGYWYGIRPYRAKLGFQGVGLLALILLTLTGGFVGSPFWWLNVPFSFSWELHPLASRMLASAGWSFVVVSAMTLRRPSQRRVRLQLLLLGVYLIPLVLAILFFHLNRFDFSAMITYAFFIVAVGMSVASVWYLWRQPLILPDDTRDEVPSRPIERNWLSIVAVFSVLWGLALFLTDDGWPPELIWHWPGDLLTSRLIGVMILAIGVGAVYARQFADTVQMMLAVLVTYGLGVSLSSLWNIWLGQPIKLSYFVIFGLIGLVSAVLLVRRRNVQANLS
ncbi:MAG: hypothetical protein AAF614_34325 [Chloroflexota bacterium]